MSRGHVRPWLQPRALFRAEVGAAWCVASGFCAFTPLCAALYLKCGLWRWGWKQGLRKDNTAAQTTSPASSDLAAWVPCTVFCEDLGSGGKINDAPRWEML